jgi:hypothetical protein
MPFCISDDVLVLWDRIFIDGGPQYRSTAKKLEGANVSQGPHDIATSKADVAGQDRATEIELFDTLGLAATVECQVPIAR